jgi:tripartite-type tricarboxylate transporter receptor subunit TctC
MIIRHFFSVTFFAAALFAVSHVSIAQEYPAKSVRMIVAGPPAGGADVVARAMGPRLTQLMGQQIIIDNRAGANGVIATEMVAKAPPDGYTVLLGTSSALTLSPNLGAVPYDPLKSFVPVSMVGLAPLMLVVHPSVPAATTQALVKLAKARPQQLLYASNGNGSLSHLTTELFKHTAGIDMVHVPYKGGTPAVIDTISGQVSLIITAVPTLLAQVKAGKVRALAVTGAKRAAVLPEISTIAESGYPGFSSYQWYAVFAPAGTAPAIVQRLNGALAKTLAAPEVQEIFTREGLEISPGGPADLGNFLAADFAKWARVVKAAGIKLD